MDDFVTVHPPQDLVHAYRRNGWWDDATLGELLDTSVAEHGGLRLNVHSRGGSQADRLSAVVELGRRVAAGLAARGIRTGDPVAFQLPNSVEAAAVFYGLVHLGAVLVPLSHNMTGTEVSSAVRRSHARAVILAAADDTDLDVEAELAEVAEHVVLVGPAIRSPRFSTFSDLAESAPLGGLACRDPAAAAVIGWTSGSTADPKGVVLSHRALCAEVRLHMAPMFAGASRPLLSTSPVSHMTGMLISLLVPPMVGRDIHLMDYWDAGDVLALMRRHGLSAGSGAPVFLQSLLDHADCSPMHHELVGQAFLGGASVSPELIARAEQLGIAATRGYGCTEHPSVSLGRPDDDLPPRAGTDGRICTGVQVKIVDDEGNPCSPGVAGEIVTRGPDMFSGYLDAAMNAEAFHRGWYRTGDIGVLDDRGYLSVRERKKDIIIRSGLNVSAAEVENVLSDMPAIAEIALVAAPNARTGEHGCAFIRPVPGHEPPDLPAVQRLLGEAGMAKYKWPEEIRIHRGDLPRTPAGKISKAELRRIARNSD